MRAHYLRARARARARVLRGRGEFPRGDHAERVRHATRIVFSRLISAACHRRSLRSQVLGLLFACQKVATAETAHRSVRVR